LLGLTRPTSGEVTVAGIRPTPDGRARALIGYVPESPEFTYPWLRVRELADYHSRYYPTWDTAYQRRLEDLLGIRTEARAGTLSKGQARCVQLLFALAHRPPVLLLDEPTDGLDPLMRRTVLKLLADHTSQTGTSTVVATHLVYEMDQLADYVAVLDSGTLRAQMRRETLDRHLRKYEFDAPFAWATLPDVRTLAQRTSASGRREWVCWGDEEKVADMLRAAGADLAHISPLSLDEATVLLLDREAAVR
jgi:ABC-2 type transport system ATP-binding protein